MLEPDCLGANPSAASFQLCDLKQVPVPVWALFSQPENGQSGACLHQLRQGCKEDLNVNTREALKRAPAIRKRSLNASLCCRLLSGLTVGAPALDLLSQLVTWACEQSRLPSPSLTQAVNVRVSSVLSSAGKPTPGPGPAACQAWETALSMLFREP